MICRAGSGHTDKSGTLITTLIKQAISRLHGKFTQLATYLNKKT